MVGFVVGGVLLVILLVIIFRRIKGHRRQNLGRDRALEFSRFGEFLFGGLGQLFLFVAGEVNRRLVGKAQVVELPSSCTESRAQVSVLLTAAAALTVQALVPATVTLSK